MTCRFMLVGNRMFLASRVLLTRTEYAVASAACYLNTSFCGMRRRIEISVAHLNPSDTPKFWQAGLRLLDVWSRADACACQTDRCPRDEISGAYGPAR